MPPNALAGPAAAGPLRGRPLVALVTSHWGHGDDEATETTRLLAGAIARHATVEVLHLVSPPSTAEALQDSIFTVHKVSVHGARPLRSGILRAALAAADGGVRVPRRAGTVLERYEGVAPGVGALLRRLAPDTVVLAGPHQPFDLADLDGHGSAARPRVVVVPFTSDPRQLAAEPLRRLVSRADVLGSLHPGEQRALVQAGRPSVPIELALPLNRGAAANRLFGVRWFGRYVLLIRSFPPGGARYVRSVTHEVLRSVLGDVSVAEVDGQTWRISDNENTLELPVSPSRVNLWRLMAHALATVDLRPPGPLGREALESMLLGTPVVVPDGSPAMEHACAANGGLWYKDTGELFDVTRALMSRPLRDRLASQAETYAQEHHGRMDDFVDRVGRLVVGT